VISSRSAPGDSILPSEKQPQHRVKIRTASEYRSRHYMFSQNFRLIETILRM